MYAPSNWQTGDTITAGKLNNIETGISNAEIGGALPRFYLVGDTTNMTGDTSVKMPFRLVNGKSIVDGFATVKWQGDSSLGMPKKNYKVKLYSDDGLSKKLNLKLFESASKNNTYNLKANYVDWTGALNLTFAKFVAIQSANRPNMDSGLLTADNFGQVQGFPIEVYINGSYNGFYTMNTGKDSNLFGMDKSNATNMAIEGEISGTDTMFQAESPDLVNNWSIEFPDSLSESQLSSFKNFYAFIKGSSDEDFIAQVEDKLDVYSVCDWVIECMAWALTDDEAKNIIFASWDGNKFTSLMYDMDLALGYSIDGTPQGNPLTDNTLDGWRKYHRLVYRLLKFPKYQKILQDRWQLFKYDCSIGKVLNQIKDFMNGVGYEQYDNDSALWPNQILSNTLGYHSIANTLKQRYEVLDEWISKISINNEIVPSTVNSNNALGDNGTLVSSAPNMATDFIELPQTGTTVTLINFSGNPKFTGRIAFFDENKKFMSRPADIDFTKPAVAQWDSPFGAKYCIVSPTTASNDGLYHNDMAVILGDILPDGWVQNPEQDVQNFVDPTSIVVSPTTGSVNVGATIQLTADILPAGTTNKSVVWSSSDESILTVDSNGLVTGVKAGSATVTATTYNGVYKAQSQLTVE